MVVTTNTKVFPTAAVEMPKHIDNQARHILNRPPALTKPVSEAFMAPPKIRVSIKGRIVQVRSIKHYFDTVFIQYQPIIKKRDFKIKLNLFVKFYGKNRYLHNLIHNF